MSGVGLHYQFPYAAMRRHLARVARVDATGFDAARREIGELFVGEVQDNLRNQHLFDGSPMPQSKAAIVDRRKTLQKQGHLRDSYVYQLTPGGVEIGSGRIYAAIHHFGGPAKAWGKHAFTMTPRPMLGMTPGLARELGRVLIDEVRRTLD